MNKLKGHFTYLCGQIDAIPDGGVSWRDSLTPWLRERGVIVMDPCKKPIDDMPDELEARADIQKMKDEGRFHEIRPKYRGIRNVDLRMCDKSDFLVAYVDMDYAIAGTVSEIDNANYSKKPVLVVCKQGRKKLNNWYHWMLPPEHLFDSFEKLKKYLDGVDSGRDANTHNRWIFFNQRKLMGLE